MEIGFIEKMNKAEASKRLFNEMVLVLGEKEEKNLTAASLLKDLYDCHHCVRYIAQMYCKGIIPAASEVDKVFNLNEEITEEIFNEWRERLYNNKLRIVPEPLNFDGIKYINKKDLTENTKLLNELASKDFVTTVVNLGEKDFFIKGVKNIRSTLQDIKLNPYGIADDKMTPIVLICDFGVKSQMAGCILAKAGYMNINVVLH